MASELIKQKQNQDKVQYQQSLMQKLWRKWEGEKNVESFSEGF